MHGRWIGYLTFVCVSIGVSGCATPKITKRYESKSFSSQSNSKHTPTLSVFSMEVPSTSAQTTLTTLPERAQAALIRELSAKSSDSAALLRALGSPIPKPTPANRIIDRTRVDRRLVFSIENRSPEPADRIHRAAIIMTVTDKAEFRSWNQFVTKFGVVNLGSLKFTQTREAGLEVKADPPQVKELTEVKGSAKAVQNLEESLNIQQRFVELTGVLTPTEARLVQEGAFGIDLTGNVVVDVSLNLGKTGTSDVDTFAFRNLAIEPKPGSTITIERQTTRYLLPSVCSPVTVTAVLESVTRAARKGDSTLMEGDDVVEFRTGTTAAQSVEIVPRETLQVSTWWLVDEANRPVSIGMSKAGQPEVLALASFDEAASLLEYLTSSTAPGVVGGRTLTLDDRPLTPQTVRRLQVEIQKLNWSSGGCAEVATPAKTVRGPRSPGIPIGPTKNGRHH